MNVECTHCGTVQETKSRVGKTSCKRCKNSFIFDREVLNKYNREWKNKHKKNILEAQARYREKNRDVLNEKAKKWYRENKEDYNSRRRQKHRDLKIKLVKEFGGKCQVCGYCKNIAVLGFHHTDPSIKENDWKLQTMIELKQEEKDSLMLVCSNCHMELHNPRLGSPGG